MAVNGSGSSGRDAHTTACAPRQQAQHASMHSRHRQYRAAFHNRPHCTLGGVLPPLALTRALLVTAVVLFVAAGGGAGPQPALCCSRGSYH